MPVITKPNQHFDATLYTGTNSSLSITNGGGFQPDFVWTKVRSATGQHVLNDSVRGVDKTLFSALTNAEQTNTAGTGITAFNSNGYTLGTQISGTGDTNGSGSTYVSWQWKAGGTAVTNTSGSISSQVSVNTTAGFSIVSYASGSAGEKTVGHGLGVTPSMIITKSRDNSSYNWSIYHSSVIDNTSKFLRFTTDAIVTSSTIWGAALPTSTVFGITSDNGVPANNNCIAYCWAEVAGYSKFGSYTGNGSTDGPFIYTGFRPAFVLTKRSDSAGNWYLWDNKRIISANGDAGLLYPDSTLAESDYNAAGMDLLSNGFKIRNSDGSDNGSGGTFIYMAFAEAPFKFSNAR